MGAVQKTKVTLTNINSGVTTVYELDGEVSSFPVDGLTPLTTYTAIAAAMTNSIYYSDPGSGVTFTTPEYTAVPASRDAGYSLYATSNLSNAFTAYDSETYASFNFAKGANAESYVYLSFANNIPTDAVIDSVTCTARCRWYNTAPSVVTRTIQMYSGATPKGNPTTVNSTSSLSSITYTLDIGTWTAAELNDAKIKLYAKRGTTDVNAGTYFWFYGATLTVVWH